MNTTKTLVGVCVTATLLGAASIVSATTVGTNTVTLSGSGSGDGGLITGTDSGTGTGTLFSSGLFTDSITNDVSISVLSESATIGETDSWTGTYASGTFTPSSGTSSATSCAGSSVICGSLTLNSPGAFGTVGGSFVFVTGGTLTATYLVDGVTVNESFAIGAGTPAPVPLPPGFWLLGSGLLALGVTARRFSPVAAR